MTKLNWDKAKRKEKFGKRRRLKGKRKFDAQPYYAAFVTKHEIACFVCGIEEAEWAKTGISKRGAWCICVPCVKAEK